MNDDERRSYRTELERVRKENDRLREAAGQADRLEKDNARLARELAALQGKP